jgi:hypothetical protein
MLALNRRSPRPSPLRNWEEWRGTTFLLPGYPLELVQEQVPRPRHGYFVDILVDARELLPVALEPLRRFVEGRRIVIELESGQISASKFRRHLAQPLLVPPLDDPDEAVLLIICRRPPRARLGYHEAVLLEPGIWQVPRGRRGAAYIVVPGLLTRAPGYALLRGSFVSRNAAEAIERMDHFLTDPLLPSDVREALMDQIGRKEVPMSDDELDALDETFRALPPSPYRDHLIRCAKRQGRKEGRQEGRQEGQEALLNVAANLMTPSEVASLANRSLGEIAAEIAARVSTLAGQQRQG